MIFFYNNCLNIMNIFGVFYLNEIHYIGINHFYNIIHIHTIGLDCIITFLERCFDL